MCKYNGKKDYVLKINNITIIIILKIKTATIHVSQSASCLLSSITDISRGGRTSYTNASIDEKSIVICFLGGMYCL